MLNQKIIVMKTIEKDIAEKEVINPAIERIDAIKKLIFGENMEEYDHKFHDVFKKLEEYHIEFEERLMSLNEKMEHEISALNKHFEKELSKAKKELENQALQLDDNKADRRELGKMLASVSDKLINK